jgi:hypothetical protein
MLLSSLIFFIVVTILVFLFNRLQDFLLVGELSKYLIEIIYMRFDVKPNLARRKFLVKELQRYGVLGPMGFNQEVFNNICFPEKYKWWMHLFIVIDLKRFYKRYCKHYVKNHINWELVVGVVGN